MSLWPISFSRSTPVVMYASRVSSDVWLSMPTFANAPQ
ncbi:unnamed protein product [Ixodes pacificus]